MFKKKYSKPKKMYKLIIEQKRGEDGIATTEYSGAKRIRYKYNKRKKWVKAIIVFSSEKRKVVLIDVISVSKIRY